MDAEVQLRSALPEDRPAIRALLAAAGLPIDDLEGATVAFVVAVAGRQVVGVAGAEALAPGAVMLRSFAVAPAHRGRGLGGQLLARLLADARQRETVEFYLLTTGARDFFAARGFSPLARDHAPEAVRAHPQFAGLCPASATLMGLSARREDA